MRTLMIVPALAACAADVPDNPSFQQDVLPILAANCVRCHGSEPLSGPAYLRLDAYEDLVRAEDDVVLGAASLAEAIAARVVDEERPMPPRFGLRDHQIEILERWAALGAPRGEPRPDNRRPFAYLGEVTGDTIEVIVGDRDRDVVGGALIVDLGTEERVLGAIASGRPHVRWDPTGVPPGAYPLRATLDDGAEAFTVELGAVTVEAR